MDGAISEQSRTMNTDTERDVPAITGYGGNAARLLVAMPALNEEKTVADTIRRVPRRIDGIGEVSILVVDDGSTDNTRQEAIRAGAVVVSRSRTGGVGKAFHAALKYALRRGFDLMVSIDSDGQFNPEDIPKLVNPVLKGEADFVTASRFADAALIPEMPRLKRWGNHFMSRLISKLIGERFHDVSCGMRCYNSDALSHLNLLSTFTYTHEVFLSLACADLDMKEVPLAVRGQREHGKSRVAHNLFRYGLNTLSILFYWYRDYRPMRFFGRVALMLILGGFGCGGFLLYHYVLTSHLTPHKWVGFMATAMISCGIVIGLFGMIGGMLNRQRIYLEELLYLQRRHTLSCGRADSAKKGVEALDSDD